MRDRLIALLEQADEYASGVFIDDYDDFLRVRADHLLAAGVIVPPYKPLPLVDECDRVLCPQCGTDLMGCYMAYDESPSVVTCYECGAWLDNTKAVTKEEAERALAERSEG